MNNRAQANARVLLQCVQHALPHRRLGLRVVMDLLTNCAAAEYRQICPYLTHTNLAKRRGAQHRNTSREILRDLAQLGFVRYWPYRYGSGIRFVIAWRKVFEYRDHNKIGSMTVPAVAINAGADGSAERWEAQRQAHKQAQAAKQAQAQAEYRARKEREARQAQLDRLADERSGEKKRLDELMYLAKTIGRDKPATNRNGPPAMTQAQALQWLRSAQARP